MRIIILIVGFSLLASCTYNKQELPEPEEISTPNSGVTITYTNHVKRIIDQNCVTCHSSSGQNPPLTNYSQVSNKALRIEARAIDNIPSTMPPSAPLPQDLKDTLQFWINQGALQ